MKDTAAVPASFAPVVTAFARDRSVSRGKMFSSSNVLSVKGKIFAILVKGKLAGHGRLIKQWISIGHGRAPWVELAKDACVFDKRSVAGSHTA
jgi:hypothetical protein